jgi:hypothetical protein
MDKKIVHSHIDADRLINDGFICRGIDRNIKDNTKLVFFFDYTDEVINKLKEYEINKKF